MNRPRRIGLGLALVAALAVALALPFVVRWSRSCEQERARAEAAWARYARESAGTPASELAARVLDALERDVAEAMAVADASPPPRTPPPSYRAAMEQLSLADGACRDR